MNTRSSTLNSSFGAPSPTGTKVEKEVRVKKRQRYISPEAQFVRLMHRFRCEVRVAYQNREVDGRSVLELMTLEPAEGSKVQVSVRGPDAAEAMQEIHRFIARIEKESRK
jgi:phosphotransferase system HPr (HPr) family protein